ncbi:MAG TPA: L,D-transpeptidase family protein [Sphingomicrobium sp.]|nr:L,D-transpeptidase family protein [Sphingomicrobium sp.]
MKRRMLASAACAALTFVCAPASGATSPEITMSSPAAFSANQAVDSFYASRHGAPLWLRAGADSSAARELIGVLERAPLDGLDSGPAIAAEAKTLMSRAQMGDSAALASADRLLSTGWVLYAEAVQRPPSGVIYADQWVRPRQQSPLQILTQAAQAPSLAAYVRKVSEVNPLYAQLRDTAWSQMQSNGGQVDPRVLTSLDRVREHPFQKRYVIVDTAAARLYMIEDGQIAGSMKVIVGKAAPGTQTPMLASTIYYATLNPYWHVSPELVRTLIAQNVLDKGLGYLKTQGYQVMPADPNDDTLLDPAKVDWHAVADGQLQVRVRELPGPANSMGRIKFGFPNKWDIYLHDTPVKALFAQDDRDLSHGCIRLQDAERLGAWMLGRDPRADSRDPELNVPLPTPVPIYVTYLTAQVNGGQLSYVDDIYGLDQAAEVAALR